MCFVQSKHPGYRRDFWPADPGPSGASKLHSFFTAVADHQHSLLTSEGHDGNANEVDMPFLKSSGRRGTVMAKNILRVRLLGVCIR
jgi:hypothetical protein